MPTPEEMFNEIIERERKRASMRMTTQPINVTQQEYDALQEAYRKAFPNSKSSMIKS